jgi:hypothetical protein
MAYLIQIADPVEAFISGYEGLSDSAREKLIRSFDVNLGEFGDTFRQDPSLRLAPESFLFRYEYLFLDEETGRVQLFRFIVSDEHAVHGILAVVFVEAN